MERHFLGEFSHIDDVYELYPSGGCYGDFIILNDTVVYWNDDQRMWGEHSGFIPVPGLVTQTVEGNLNVGQDLKVGGTISAKDGVFDKLTVNDIDMKSNRFAPASHSHPIYANKKHTHLLADIRDLLDYIDGALAESGFSLVAVWQALAGDSDNQINISHLEDVIYKLRDEFVSKKVDDVVNGNIGFKKKIDVGGVATFRDGAIFISNRLPEEIHDSVIEPIDELATDEYYEPLSTVIIEESERNETVGTGYVEEFSNKEKL